MNTPYPQTASRPYVSSKKLVKLERTGRYEDALAEVRHLWPDLSAMPDIGDQPPREAAEMLLRCGSLIGFLGHVRSIPHAQERSKNLLTEARRRFLEIYDTAKIAECENYLALAYWRTGEINEVEAWIGASQSHDLPDSSFERLYSHIIRCLGLLAEKDHTGIVSYLAPLEHDFLRAGEAGLKGDFYNHYGIAHQELGHIEEAMRCFGLALEFHRKSGHKIYLGTVRNNIAMLLKKVGRHAEAHSEIDSAIKIYRQIKDRTREGSSLDTKALIYFSEKKYDEALKVLEKALIILRKTENSAYLIETLMTKVKTLVFMEDIAKASLSLVEAVGIAREYTGEKGAKALSEEFEAAIREKTMPPAALPAPSAPAKREVRRDRKNDSISGGGLRLVLPPSISHYTDYQGVWINGTHLEKAGLTQGALAVVVNEEVKRGDLVAIVETSSDLVSCGYYDADFGMISLEGDDAGLQVFNESEVKILGRIVGVCNTGTGPDGKMIVEPVKI